jgi:hypothetical protein
MNKTIPISANNIQVEVKATHDRPDNIKAFGELQILSDDNVDPILKVRGFTIRLKQFGAKEVLSVTFPAYMAKRRYQTSFIIENKNLYKDIVYLFLDTYYHEIGETPPERKPDEYVDPDEIPF